MRRAAHKANDRRVAAAVTLVPPLDAPRRLRRTVLDFRTLHLPREVAALLCEAFWQRLGAARLQTLFDHWSRLRVFGRFNEEIGAVRAIADLRGALLLRYVEWLNVQRTGAGAPLGKATRAATYTTLLKLLQWLVRCRPALVGPFDWPVNPFPWRNRDTRSRPPLSAAQLREILKACERDIAETRLLRARGQALRCAARARGARYTTDAGALLDYIDSEFGGVLPPTPVLYRTHNHFCRYLFMHGGVTSIEPYLYPNLSGLFPYYLAIVLHTAGNPEAIAELRIDCLQPVPLLEDREMLCWMKPRAASIQRRSFPRSDPFAPPALVREILEWTRPLRSRVPPADRNRLLLIKTSNSGPRAASRVAFVRALRRFITRHELKPFALASLRASVLSALYRSSGDLRVVKRAANHASITTTARYVQGREVAAADTVRMAALQSAWLGHLDPTAGSAAAPAHPAGAPEGPASGEAVSMFGFSCTDPLAGVAPGTRRGELCTNFLACLSCPNAIIPTDAPTLARLLQARDHLREAAAHVHPARWEALYAPQLRILEEDLLPRFAALDRPAAERLRPSLPPLLPLR